MPDEDPFEGLRLDEDFVRGATRHELSAKMRSRQGKASIGNSASLIRRRWRRRAVVGVICALAGGAIAVAASHQSSSSTRTKQVVAPTPTPSRLHRPRTELVDQTFNDGSCYRWQLGVINQHAVEVPCGSPHLFLAVGSTTVGGAIGHSTHFPSPKQWRSINATYCAPRITRYLGRPLDPAGRYFADRIQPVKRSWTDLGDRKIVCGIGAVPRFVYGKPPPTSALFTGVVHPGQETLVRPAGTCLRAQHHRTAVVACRRPHQTEVAGQVSLALPATASQSTVDQVAGPRCQSVITTFLGRSLRSDELVFYQGVDAASWAAGSRTVTCLIGFGSYSHQVLHRGTA
jgi:hypothetical protein